MIDRILYNGDFITLDSKTTKVTALALIGERIVAMGSDDQIVPLASTTTIKQNLNGKTVIPGLIDAHIHWQMTARALSDVNVFEVPTKAVALERVAERVKTMPTSAWVFGHGWTQDYWPDRAF